MNVTSYGNCVFVDVIKLKIWSSESRPSYNVTGVLTRREIFRHMPTEENIM